MSASRHILRHVVLVTDITNKLFCEIFQSDNTVSAAVLIDDNGQMLTLLTHQTQAWQQAGSARN